VNAVTLHKGAETIRRRRISMFAPPISGAYIG
jgi:hypothetical protein